MTEKSFENKMRRELAKKGYLLKKRMPSKYDIYHSGCYRIVNAYSNYIEAGENFDLTIEDVQRFVEE